MSVLTGSRSPGPVAKHHRATTHGCRWHQLCFCSIPSNLEDARGARGVRSPDPTELNHFNLSVNHDIYHQLSSLFVVGKTGSQHLYGIRKKVIWGEFCFSPTPVVVTLIFLDLISSTSSWPNLPPKRSTKPPVFWVPRWGHVPPGASWIFLHASQLWEGKRDLGVPCIPSPNLYFELVSWVLCTSLTRGKQIQPHSNHPLICRQHLCPLPAVLSTWGCWEGGGAASRAPAACSRGRHHSPLERSHLSFQWRGASYFVAQLFIFIEFEASCTWEIHPFVATFEDN